MKREESRLAGYRAKPAAEIAGDAKFNFAGVIGRLIDGLIGQWVLPVPFSNPEMLEMFRDPDQLPLRNRVPWAGEFAGKYLTHAVQLYRLAPERKLRRQIEWFVGELIALQTDDGYLGPWPESCRLKNHAPNSSGSTNYTWDTWGHYHIMLGLILWYRESGSLPALACCRRIADLLCNSFLAKGLPIAPTGWEEVNQAPIHSLCLLYLETGEQAYLDLALRIEKEFELPGAGDYIREALAGREFFQTPKPRWESLHPVMGISELYFLTGRKIYRRAFEQIWWSIAKTDRHNNGGFSAGEKAQGSPYHEGAIETCCTVAWTALSVEMLRLTGNPVAADEIELSLFNSGLGFTNPTGRWVTYNTPMDGSRIASPNDTTSFQARPAGAELNCCSVNGPRIFGMISDWALMQRSGGGLALNYYGPGTITAGLPGGNSVVLEQHTDYPWENTVAVKVRPERAGRFSIALRIPAWSGLSVVRVNGRKIADVRAGRYLTLDRVWRSGDRIDIEFDFRLHFWAKDAGITAGVRSTSVYRGPVLLAYDPRFNAGGEIPLLDVNRTARRIELETWLKPNLLMEFPGENGGVVRLCDFASAGAAGHVYRSWLPVKYGRLPGCRFSRKNPLRTFRVKSSAK